jgi:uncharacterized membrane protein
MNTPSLFAPLRRRGYDLPIDLTVVVSLTVVAWGAVFLPLVRDTPLRLGLGVLLVLFLPGYALLAALYPGAGGTIPASLTGAHSHSNARLDGLDRLLLAVALSLALTVVVAMLLSVSRWGFTVVPTTLALGVVTLACCIVAAVRRARLPPEDRFTLRPSAVSALTDAAFVDAPRRTRLLNVLVVCGVVVAGASIAYAAVAPSPTAPFSEFYLLSVGSAAEPTTQGYDIIPGSDITFRVGVVNHERAIVDYTVVVLAQQLAVEGETERVVAQTELDRIRLRVAPGETREVDHTIPAEADLSGSQRVAYLLHRSSPPAFPTADSAYRSLYVTVDS